LSRETRGITHHKGCAPKKAGTTPQRSRGRKRALNPRKKKKKKKRMSSYDAGLTQRGGSADSGSNERKGKIKSSSNGKKKGAMGMRRKGKSNVIGSVVVAEKWGVRPQSRSETQAFGRTQT